MSAYMVISVIPQDDEKMRDYESRTLDVVSRYGGRPIARDTECIVLEADQRPGIGVILEFPDKQAVLDFYHSEDYKPLKEFRHTFATAGALVIDSV
ncbi:DUF1330 domain-containing protein [Streptomyces sp. NBC_00481]|uniref:DUF1330 domain-containing protein n=1 Tax=unclassified Streptomyces TaxID=2593676 RepID=UPI002DDC5C5A|nr:MULTISPECIES: DUF1330 domain-containing protein [unclassified Streptomyces]WRY94349.1 DUF1330 domain-containing protein [Streptomyces sp. NBC_00481]